MGMRRYNFHNPNNNPTEAIYLFIFAEWNLFLFSALHRKSLFPFKTLSLTVSGPPIRHQCYGFCLHSILESLPSLPIIIIPH